MSYSDLIQRDNPAIVWSLDDTDNTVRPDSFMYRTYANSSTKTYYTGTYSNVVKTGLPLIYGGKQSIKITDNAGYVRVPSLDKMSLKDSRNYSSLEFWVKLNSSSNTEQVLVNKGPSYKTEIYIKDDYISFRLGKSTKYYEVSVPIDTINKPIHVVANYSKEAITLIVNGISKTKSISDPDSLFPAYDPSDEYFYFGRPTGITQVEYDCISLYSYSLPREKALKHFIYGVGYSLPSEIVNSNGGVFYNFSMDGHKEINKYDMGPGTAWSITEANNCLIQNGLLTIKNKQEPKTYFAENASILDTQLFTSSNRYTFVSGSYLEIENINSIIPDSVGGWAGKFDDGTYSSNKKVLLTIGSKSSQNYIEFYTITESSTNKINVDINGTITTLKTGHSLSTSFYVGYYKDLGGVSNAFFLTTGSQVITPLDIPEIPSAYARFGSDNIWFEGSDITKIDESDIGLSDSNLLRIVGIHKDNELLYDSISEIESGSFKNYYTAIPNRSERRFKIKSYAQATIDIDQQLLCPPLSEVTGACRIEIGNPSGSNSVGVSLYEKKYSNGIETLSVERYENDYINRVITSGTWLNKKVTQTENSETNPVDALSFVFTFKTDDLSDRPPYLNYFRIASYALNDDPNDTNDYVLNNSSPGGNPAKIYLKSGECNIPDLIEMPFFYNGYKSGLKLKTSYAKINHNFTSVQKFAQIANITTASGNTTYALSDNPFLAGDVVSVSEINGTNGFAFLNKTISSVSGNNVTFNSFVPTSTITSASYNSATSATFTTPLTTQIFSVGQVISISGVTGGSYNKTVTVSAIGGTSGAYTFTATGTGFTNVAGTGGFYYILDSDLTDGTAGVMQLGSGIRTVSFMAYIESATTPGTALKIIKIGDSQFTANNFSGARVLANATTYINGVAYSLSTNPVKLNEWQMITLVFNTPFYINNSNSVEIVLGDPTSALATNSYIDQLMIFDKELITNSGLGSLDNLYNTFVGNITSNFKSTKSKEVIIIDENDLGLSSIQCDHILSSGDIYDALASGLATETLSITYKKSKPDIISKKVQRTAATGQATIFLSDTSGLLAGSIRVDSSNKNELGTISSLDATATKRDLKTENTNNGDIPKVRSKDKFISTPVTLASSTGVEVGDKVVKSGYLDPGATVASKSGNIISIKFNTPNTKYKPKLYGLIQTIPKNSPISFIEPFPKIVMSSNLTTAIKKDTILYFKDKNYDGNLDEREKLKIGSKYIKNDDMILVRNTTGHKYFLYKVTSGASEAFTIPNGIAKTYTVTFTKQELSASEVYAISNEKVYSYSQSATIKLIELTPTKLASLQKRVTSKPAPQYAITE
jgi:hypothetical protein